MIGKVIRGTNARRLLYYLYGQGKANEHTDPHLVAGFGDPAELEPERRRDGTRDFRRLTGLLTQPLAALAGPGYDKPVWHCPVRAAPEDRTLSDAEWAQVAAKVMQQTGLAPGDDDLGVRWVAVRHAPDHIHIVATLARQDGTRPKVWNDFYRVREACRESEQLLGLRSTAPADRTAARRATRAEMQQAARRGWGETPRAALRREVCTAAAGACSEQEFFARLQDAGVVVRLRYSSVNAGEVTGYAVGLRQHTDRTGGIVWYGGGKLAADLTLPKLRARWAGPGGDGDLLGQDAPTAVTRAVLRDKVMTVAQQARDEGGFFAELRNGGVEVRLRYSQVNPGEVTGYAVALPGHQGAGGAPCWYGGGQLAAGLSLPRLRSRWAGTRSATAGRSGAPRITADEREEIYRHAARQAGEAAEHIRRCSITDPDACADAAWAAAETLHAAARSVRNPGLRRAADAYDRAARMAHGRVPRRNRHGNQLRAAARWLTLARHLGGEPATGVAGLAVQLVPLTEAVAGLRRAQQHAAQASAARAAAEHLHAGLLRAQPAHASVVAARRRGQKTGGATVSRDFPAPPGTAPSAGGPRIDKAAGQRSPRRRPGSGPAP